MTAPAVAVDSTIAVSVLSVLGLLFAAVAAIGSVVTVKLTIDYHRDLRMWRLAEALIVIRGAAAEVIPAHAASPVQRSDRFDSAQEELQRAVALPLHGIEADVQTRIDSLLADEAWRDPQHAAMAARYAHNRLAVPPFKKPWRQRRPRRR